MIFTTKSNKIKSKILVGTVSFSFVINSACSEKWNRSTEMSGESIAEKIQVIQPQTRDYKKIFQIAPNGVPVLSESDFQKLEYFLLNSTFPTKTKINIIQEYISYLSEKNKIDKFEVVKQFEYYFQVPTENDLLIKLSSIKSGLMNQQQQISIQSGIPILKNTTTDKQDMNFLSDFSEVKRLQTLNYYQQLKLDLLSQKAQTTSATVFRTIDAQANKLASDTLAALAKNKEKDMVDKIKWISTLKEKEASIESIKLAAQLAEKTDAKDEKEKKSTTIYYYEVIKEAAKDPEKFNNDLLLKVNDPKVLESAKKFSKVSGILAKYSESKREKLLDISKQLGQFSKDGIVKIDLTDITKDEKFKEKADAFGKKVSGYLEDGQELLNFAKGAGVDPEICDKAQTVIDVAGKGVQLVTAFASSNPIAIMGAVSSVFSLGSSSGPTKAELEMKQMQAKMDMMITLQNRTLDELSKARQDIIEIRNSIADTQKLIGSLSVQIAEGNKILFDEIEMVSGVVKQVRDLVQSGLRQDASTCISLDVQDKQPIEFLVDSDRYYEISIDKCLSSMTSLNLNIKSNMDVFKSIKKETEGDLYKRAISINKNNLNEFKANAFSLNPVFSVYSFLEKLNETYLVANKQTQILSDYVRKENSRSDDLLDVEYLTAYASSVTKLAPYLSVYSTGMKNNISDFITASLGRMDNILIPYTKLLDVLNVAIFQMSYMSGVVSADMTTDEMHAFNNAFDTKTKCELDKDLENKYCFFHGNETARKNLLKLQFVKELKQKFNSVVAYTNLVDMDLDRTQKSLSKAFDSSWDFKIENGQVTTKVGMDRMPIPTNEDIQSAKFENRIELKYLLAARNNLIELLSDMKQNRIPDESTRRLLMMATLKKAL